MNGGASPWRIGDGCICFPILMTSENSFIRIIEFIRHKVCIINVFEDTVLSMLCVELKTEKTRINIVYI